MTARQWAKKALSAATYGADKLTTGELLDKLEPLFEQHAAEVRERCAKPEDEAKHLRDYGTVDPAPQSTARDDVINAKSFDDWHEDMGPVLWVSFPIEEAPWCGTPLDSGWPSYHTHWIPLPDCNRIVRALTSNDGTEH